jgi:prophage antirepressor-like protein
MNNLLIKKFQESDITIYGTSDKPLFKANDIGDLLGISQIRKTIQNLDEEFKVFQVGNTITGLQDQWFLTIQGLYEVLFITRKPLAKEFRKWVTSVLEEIRKTGEYKSNKKIEQTTRNTLFIEQYQNKPVLYLGMVEDTQDQQIVKYGYTQDTKTTLKRHQDSYGEDFNYIHALECKEHYKLENKIQNHNDLSTRHIKKYNGKDRQELLRLDKNFSVKNLIDLIANLKTTMDSDRELELKEIELDQDKEKTKQIQEQEKTKQLQIQLEIKKLELGYYSIPQTKLSSINIVTELQLREVIGKNHDLYEELIEHFPKFIEKHLIKTKCEDDMVNVVCLKFDYKMHCLTIAGIAYSDDIINKMMDLYYTGPELIGYKLVYYPDDYPMLEKLGLKKRLTDLEVKRRRLRELENEA